MRKAFEYVRRSIHVMTGTVLMLPASALALESTSFMISDGSFNYASGGPNESSSFAVDADQVTWIAKPMASTSFSVVVSPITEQSAPVSLPSEGGENSGGGGGGGGSSGSSGGSGGGGGGGRRPRPAAPPSSPTHGAADEEPADWSDVNPGETSDEPGAPIGDYTSLPIQKQDSIILGDPVHLRDVSEVEASHRDVPVLGSAVHQQDDSSAPRDRIHREATHEAAPSCPAVIACSLQTGYTIPWWVWAVIATLTFLVIARRPFLLPLLTSRNHRYFVRWTIYPREEQKDFPIYMDV